MNKGTIYLIHADAPLAHARHYLGFTQREVEQRVREHEQGNGSPLLRAMNLKGIAYKVVRVWVGTRTDERRLKNRKNARTLCPACNPNLGGLKS